MKVDDFIIDESNFKDYFIDIKSTGPKPGQIMARFITKAELVNGDDKGYLIDLLLTNPMGAEMGIQIARNSFAAQDPLGLVEEVAKDLQNKSRDEVMDKPYPYTLEKFFWTKEEYVPKDDPHWQVIKISFENDKEV